MKILRFLGVLFGVFCFGVGHASAAITITLSAPNARVTDYSENGQNFPGPFTGTTEIYVEQNQIYFYDENSSQTFLPYNNGVQAKIEIPQRFFVVNYVANCPSNSNLVVEPGFVKWGFDGYFDSTSDEGIQMFDSLGRLTENGERYAISYTDNTTPEWYEKWTLNEYTPVQFPTVNCNGYDLVGWFDNNGDQVVYNSNCSAEHGGCAGYIPTDDITLYGKWQKSESNVEKYSIYVSCSEKDPAPTLFGSLNAGESLDMSSVQSEIDALCKFPCGDGQMNFNVYINGENDTLLGPTNDSPVSSITGGASYTIGQTPYNAPTAIILVPSCVDNTDKDYVVTLDDNDATTSGSEHVYISGGVAYTDQETTAGNEMTANDNPIDKPEKCFTITFTDDSNTNNGPLWTEQNVCATFLGYFASNVTGATQYIDGNGKVTSDGISHVANMSTSETWYAQWSYPTWSSIYNNVMSHLFTNNGSLLTRVYDPNNLSYNYFKINSVCGGPNDTGTASTSLDITIQSDLGLYLTYVACGWTQGANNASFTLNQSGISTDVCNYDVTCATGYHQDGAGNNTTSFTWTSPSYTYSLAQCPNATGLASRDCVPNTYNIIYVGMTNIATTNENTPSTYSYDTGATIGAPTMATGYVFKGWCEGSTATQCETFESVVTIAANTTGAKEFAIVWACDTSNGYAYDNDTQTCEPVDYEVNMRCVNSKASAEYSVILEFNESFEVVADNITCPTECDSFDVYLGDDENAQPGALEDGDTFNVGSDYNGATEINLICRAAAREIDLITYASTPGSPYTAQGANNSTEPVPQKLYVSSGRIYSDSNMATLFTSLTSLPTYVQTVNANLNGGTCTDTVTYPDFDGTSHTHNRTFAGYYSPKPIENGVVGNAFWVQSNTNTRQYIDASGNLLSAGTANATSDNYDSKWYAVWENWNNNLPFRDMKKDNMVFYGWETTANNETNTRTPSHNNATYFGSSVIAHSISLTAQWEACNWPTGEHATSYLATPAVVDNTCKYITECEEGYMFIDSNNVRRYHGDAFADPATDGSRYCATGGVNSGSYGPCVISNEQGHTIQNNRLSSCVNAVYDIQYTHTANAAISNLPSEYTYGTGATIGAPIMATGYIYDGWCANTDCSTPDNSFVISTSATGNKTLYMKWHCDEENDYVYNESQDTCELDPMHGLHTIRLVTYGNDGTCFNGGIPEAGNTTDPVPLTLYADSDGVYSDINKTPFSALSSTPTYKQTIIMEMNGGSCTNCTGASAYVPTATPSNPYIRWLNFAGYANKGNCDNNYFFLKPQYDRSVYINNEANLTPLGLTTGKNLDNDTYWYATWSLAQLAIPMSKMERDNYVFQGWQSQTLAHPDYMALTNGAGDSYIDVVGHNFHYKALWAACAWPEGEHSSIVSHEVVNNTCKYTAECDEGFMFILNGVRYYNGNPFVDPATDGSKYCATGGVTYVSGESTPCSVGYFANTIATYHLSDCEVARYRFTYACGTASGQSQTTDVTHSNHPYTVADAPNTNWCNPGTGYVFNGWKWDHDNETYDPGDTISDWYYDQTTFTAQWTCDEGYTMVGSTCVEDPKYTIELVCLNEDSIELLYNAAANVSYSTPVDPNADLCKRPVCQTGYSAASYNVLIGDTPATNNTPINYGTTITTGVTYGPDATLIKLVPNCQIITYDVTYSCGIASGDAQTENIQYGATHTVWDAPNTDWCDPGTGYVFNGWEWDHDNATYNPGDTISNWDYDQTTFTAQWTCDTGYASNPDTGECEEIQYQLKFDCTAGRYWQVSGNNSNPKYMDVDLNVPVQLTSEYFYCEPKSAYVNWVLPEFRWHATGQALEGNICTGGGQYRVNEYFTLSCPTNPVFPLTPPDYLIKKTINYYCTSDISGDPDHSQQIEYNDRNNVNIPGYSMCNDVMGDHYVFQYWYNYSNLTTQAIQNQTLNPGTENDILWGPGYTSTFKAQWTCEQGYTMVDGTCVENAYNITYSCGNASGDAQTANIQYGATHTVWDAPNTDWCDPGTGYVFNDWEWDHDNATYNPGDTISNWDYDQTTFTAQWTCDTGYIMVNGACVAYTLTFDCESRLYEPRNGVNPADMSILLNQTVQLYAAEACSIKSAMQDVAMWHQLAWKWRYNRHVQPYCGNYESQTTARGDFTLYCPDNPVVNIYATDTPISKTIRYYCSTPTTGHPNHTDNVTYENKDSYQVWDGTGCRGAEWRLVQWHKTGYTQYSGNALMNQTLTPDTPNADLVWAPSTSVTYYGEWECAEGYTMENGTCVEDTKYTIKLRCPGDDMELLHNAAANVSYNTPVDPNGINLCKLSVCQTGYSATSYNVLIGDDYTQAPNNTPINYGATITTGVTYGPDATLITLQPNCQINTYDVTYACGNASGNNQIDSNVQYGATYTVWDAPDTNWCTPGDGYVFNGWYSDFTGQAATYNPGAQIQNWQYEATFIAQWTCAEGYTMESGVCVEDPKYTIKLRCPDGDMGLLYDLAANVPYTTPVDPNGTSLCKLSVCQTGYSATSYNVLIGDDYTQAPNNTPINYGATITTGVTYGPDATLITLQPNCQINTYEVIYSCGNASGNNQIDSNVQYGATYTVWDAPDTNWCTPGDGYVFNGWYSDFTGQAATYNPGAQIQNWQYEATFIAQWTCEEGYTMESGVCVEDPKYTIKLRCPGDDMELLHNAAANVSYNTPVDPNGAGLCKNPVCQTGYIAASYDVFIGDNYTPATNNTPIGLDETITTGVTYGEDATLITLEPNCQATAFNVFYACSDEDVINQNWVHTDTATYGQDYSVYNNDTPGHQCQSLPGQELRWHIVGSTINYAPGYVIQDWSPTNTPVIFVPYYEQDCYAITFDDTANGGISAGNGPLYRKHYNTGDYNWYQTSKCAGEHATQITAPEHPDDLSFIGYWTAQVTDGQRVTNGDGYTRLINEISNWPSGDSTVYARFANVNNVKYMCYVNSPTVKPDTAIVGQPYVVQSINYMNDVTPALCNLNVTNFDGWWFSAAPNSGLYGPHSAGTSSGLIEVINPWPGVYDEPTFIPGYRLDYDCNNYPFVPRPSGPDSVIYPLGDTVGMLDVLDACRIANGAEGWYDFDNARWETDDYSFDLPAGSPLPIPGANCVDTRVVASGGTLYYDCPVNWAFLPVADPLEKTIELSCGEGDTTQTVSYNYETATNPEEFANMVYGWFLKNCDANPCTDPAGDELGYKRVCASNWGNNAPASWEQLGVVDGKTCYKMEDSHSLEEISNIETLVGLTVTWVYECPHYVRYKCQPDSTPYQNEPYAYFGRPYTVLNTGTVGCEIPEGTQFTEWQVIEPTNDSTTFEQNQQVASWGYNQDVTLLAQWDCVEGYTMTDNVCVENPKYNVDVICASGGNPMHVLVEAQAGYSYVTPTLVALQKLCPEGCIFGDYTNYNVYIGDEMEEANSNNPLNLGTTIVTGQTYGADATLVTLIPNCPAVPYTIEYKCKLSDEDPVSTYSPLNHGDTHNVSNVYNLKCTGVCPYDVYDNSYSVYLGDNNTPAASGQYNPLADNATIVAGETYGESAMLVTLVPNCPADAVHMIHLRDLTTNVTSTTPPSPEDLYANSTGVYRDGVPLTNIMGLNTNPLYNIPTYDQTIATNFDGGWCDNCSADYPVADEQPHTVNLNFHAYMPRYGNELMFWDTEPGNNGKPAYINNQGYITQDGINEGQSLTDDTTWYAVWKKHTWQLPYIRMHKNNMVIHGWQTGTNSPIKPSRNNSVATGNISFYQHYALYTAQWKSCNWPTGEYATSYLATPAVEDNTCKYITECDEGYMFIDSNGVRHYHGNPFVDPATDGSRYCADPADAASGYGPCVISNEQGHTIQHNRLSSCTAAEYPIIYDCGTVAGGQQTTTIPHGATHTVWDAPNWCAPSAGQEFAGWYFNKDQTIHSAGDQITNWGYTNGMFTAQWNCKDGYTPNGNGCVPNQITIIYDGDCVSAINPPTDTCVYGETFTSATATTVTGYTSDQWTTSVNTFNANSIVSCHFDTLGVYEGTAYAHAVCKNSKIIIDWQENGGGALPNGACIYNQTLTLANQPTRPGYVFDGWELANGTYVDQNTVMQNGCVTTYLGPIPNNISTSITAQWCKECVPPANSTCVVDVTVPGICNYICEPGYTPTADGVCEPDTYHITYMPNGGTPNESRIQEVQYGGDFTTLGATTFSRTNHILLGWERVSGGNFPDLRTSYTYITDPAGVDTVLNAKWAKCICDTGTGVDSCATESVNNLCVATAVCADGYENPDVTCEGTNCSSSCQPSVYNIYYTLNGGTNYSDAPTTYTYGVGATIGENAQVPTRANSEFVGWCDDAALTQNCAPMRVISTTDLGDKYFYAKWVCDSGYLSTPDGQECITCPEGYHYENGQCLPDVDSETCTLPNASQAERYWDPAIEAYGSCIILECKPGYHIATNACVANESVCNISNGTGRRVWDDAQAQWSDCEVLQCNPGFEQVGNECQECPNRRIGNEVVVSTYSSGCKIASCMYQGQKYKLDTTYSMEGECVPICISDTDHTGTQEWNESRKKCVRTCNPGYKL